jgi:hypothetical protein
MTLRAISTSALNSGSGFSYLFKSNIKVYSFHQEIAHMSLGIISTSAPFLRVTKQSQLFIIFLKKTLLNLVATRGESPGGKQLGADRYRSECT